MNHVIVCREYPPAPTPPGGIGTYVVNVSRLLAEAGETVHIVGQRWPGAPRAVEELCGGRLIVHRLPLDETVAGEGAPSDHAAARHEANAFARSDFPAQYFSLQAARLIERLVQHEGIDAIEAQEWEAPLYYFQLRRALGLGPSRRPPCIVHLHSPTEFLFRHNEWDLGRADYLPAKRMEDYSIAAADGLLCPSHYLAGQAATHYGLASDAIEVIPCPIGDFPMLTRDADVWSRGSICYVGRLEPRKGVIEWVEAAVSLADAHPTTVFEFVGADLPYTADVSVRQHVERAIPERLKGRFLFHGPQRHDALPRFLGRAWAAVVPSRWENFPNTCIEAMCTGLPVIAARDGGMGEMIEDERTGWLARASGPAGLADALSRALATPAERRAAMGRAAATAIREVCDAKRILDRHIAFRRRVADGGASRSLRLPPTLPWAGRRLADDARRRTATTPGGGIGLVVTCLDAERDGLSDCLAALRAQTVPPTAIVLVVERAGEGYARAAAAGLPGLIVCAHATRPRAAARNAGVSAVLEHGTRPVAFAFVEPGDRLSREFVERCGSVLQHCPEVGLVSSWTADPTGSRWAVHPCPALPYELLASETSAVSVIRTEALREVGLFRADMLPGYDDWDLAVAVMAAGWVAVTFPAVLAARAAGAGARPHARRPGHVRMRRALLARFPDLVARDAATLVMLAEARASSVVAGPAAVRRAARSTRYGPSPRELLGRPAAEQIAALRRAVRRPRATTRWMAWYAWRAVAIAGARLFARRGDPR